VTARRTAAAGKGALEPYRKRLQGTVAPGGRAHPTAVPLWAEPGSRAAGARAATRGVWGDSGRVLACSHKNQLVSSKRSFWTKCGSQQSGNLHRRATHSGELLQSSTWCLLRLF